MKQKTWFASIFMIQFILLLEWFALFGSAAPLLPKVFVGSATAIDGVGCCLCLIRKEKEDGPVIKLLHFGALVLMVIGFGCWIVTRR